MKDTKLKATVNSQALVKIGELLSNSVMLGANVFLIGSSVSNAIRSRRQEQIRPNLQLSCEVASAVAGLSKVIMEHLDHGTGNSDVRA